MAGLTNESNLLSLWFFGDRACLDWHTVFVGVVSVTEEKKRTDQQRKAIEVYCRELGEALNNAGYEMKAVLKVKQVDVPWTQNLVKEVLFKPIMQSMTEKFSTTELERTEVNDVYEVLDRHISSNFGVHVEFPRHE